MDVKKQHLWKGVGVQLLQVIFRAFFFFPSSLNTFNSSLEAECLSLVS